MRRVRVAVTGMFAVAGLLCGIFTGRFPALVDRFGLSPAHLGTVLFVWALCAALATLAVRRAVARFGGAAVLRAAAPASAVALVAVAAAPGFGTMLAAVGVFGAAFGVLEIAVNGQGTVVERTYGRPLLGGMHAAWGVGAIAGGALAAGSGYLGTGYGWSVGPVAACALPVTVLLGRGLRGPAPVGSAAADRPGRHRRTGPAVRLLCVAAFAAFVVEASVADWCGVLLRHELGTSHAVAALGYPLFQCGLLSGRLVTDRIRAAHGSRRVLAGGGLATAAAVAVAGSVPHPVVALVALYVVGVTIGPVLPTAFSAAAALDRRADGSAVARIGTAGYTGLLAGPVMVAASTSVGTLAAGLGTVVVVFGVAVAAVAAALAPRADAASGPERPDARRAARGGADVVTLR